VFKFWARRPAKRQRLENLDASHLVQRLLTRVGSGEMRPTTAQQTALDAVRDGLPSAAVAALSSLGNSGESHRPEIGGTEHRLWGVHDREITAARRARLQVEPFGRGDPVCRWLAHRHGRSPQNIERDMHRWLAHLHGMELEPYDVAVPLWDGDGVNDIIVPMLLPHHWMAALHAAGAAIFEGSMIGDGGHDDICRFWEWSIEQPWAAEHPAHDAPDSWWQHIPLCIHSDGGEAYSNYELQVWSLSSMLVHGKESWDWKYVICTIPTWRMPSKTVRNAPASIAFAQTRSADARISREVVPARLRGEHAWCGLACKCPLVSGLHGCSRITCFWAQAALDKMMSVLAWSFRSCSSGKWPLVGPSGEALSGTWAARAGQMLAGGYRGSYVAWKGDRKSRVEEHRLSRTWQTTSCCEFCEAVIPFASAASPLLTYADCRPAAPGAEQLASLHTGALPLVTGFRQACPRPSPLHLMLAGSPSCRGHIAGRYAAIDTRIPLDPPAPPRLWRSTLRPHAVYMRQAPHEISPYSQIAGFSLHTLMPDLLHVFHLGIGQDLGASCLCWLLASGYLPPQRTMEEQLADLGLEIRAWCCAKGLRAPPRCPCGHHLPVPCPTSA
jgi:hypothetical protein